MKRFFQMIDSLCTQAMAFVTGMWLKPVRVRVQIRHKKSDS